MLNRLHLVQLSYSVENNLVQFAPVQFSLDRISSVRFSRRAAGQLPDAVARHRRWAAAPLESQVRVHLHDEDQQHDDDLLSWWYKRVSCLAGAPLVHAAHALSRTQVHASFTMLLQERGWQFIPDTSKTFVLLHDDMHTHWYVAQLTDSIIVAQSEVFA
jgi:hypothetical protein